MAACNLMGLYKVLKGTDKLFRSRDVAAFLDM